MSESTHPQAPQGEFRCPQCGGEKHAATDQGDFVCVCGHYFDPPQAEADVLAARQGAQPILTPEFVAAAEIEANTPIATVTGSTALVLEIESLKQQLAEAREQLETAQDRISVLIKTQPPHETVVEAADRATDEAVRQLEKRGRVIMKEDRDIIQAACADACQEWRAHFNFGCELREECERENNDLREQLAAVTAERDKLAAEGAMLRQVFGEVIDWQGIDHEDDNCPEDDTCSCELVAKVNAAFKNSPTTAAEAERVRRLENDLQTEREQAAAAAIIGTESLLSRYLDKDDLSQFLVWLGKYGGCNAKSIQRKIDEMPDEVRKALAALDAAKGGA